MLGGQKLVAVTTTEPGRHAWLPPPAASHRTSKQAPQLSPLLKSAVLSAAVRVPYPCEYRLPYPHAPPAKHDDHADTALESNTIISAVLPCS